MRSRSNFSLTVILSVVSLFVALPTTASAEPLSKVKLLELASKGVDPVLIRTLVERDCVSFDIDADTLVELSSKVPADVLEAAMRCRGPRAHQSEVKSDSAPSPPSPPAIPLGSVRSVAIIPVALGGIVDAGTTDYLMKQVASREPSWAVIDPVQVQLKFEGSSPFEPNAPLLSLLRAAQATGADAILLGTGSYYRVMGYPGVSLDLKLIEVNRGTVLWSADGASKGGGVSEENAKHMAVRSATRKLPR